MKASHITLGLLLLAGAASCDNISEDDRYIKVEKPSVENPRNLLVFDFTGNTCPNCPEGALTLEKIKEEEAPGRVITVGLHPSGYGFTSPIVADNPTPHLQDFRCETATALAKYYEPVAFPSAVFNGIKSSMSSFSTNWPTIADEYLRIPAAMTISASDTYDSDTRELKVDYTVDFGSTVDSRLNVSVWLMENDILGAQDKNGSPRDQNYIHNHVLRASLNGDWGEYIGDKFYPEDQKSGSASITLSEKWVAENCEIVVFVSRESDRGVEQAISLKLETEN